MILHSPEIDSRNEFPLLCNWRKLLTAVEVGVDRGEYSHHFLSQWYGHNFVGIDNYAPYPEMPWNRDADYQFAVIRYERHAARAKLIKGNSLELAVHFLPENKSEFFGGHPTHFVYIDGDHAYDAVNADIQAWWPVVSDIGILAGHDFNDDHPGVVQAVTEFAEREQLTIYLTDKDRCPSWYCYKRGIPGPEWIRREAENLWTASPTPAAV